MNVEAVNKIEEIKEWIQDKSKQTTRSKSKSRNSQQSQSHFKSTNTSRTSRGKQRRGRKIGGGSERFHGRNGLSNNHEIRSQGSKQTSNGGNRQNDQGHVKTFLNGLRNNNRSQGSTGIVQRIDFDTAMPMFEPSVTHYGKTGEGLCVRGSEYLTDITAYVGTITPTATPSAQGSFLYSVPINPSFWGGTRIKKFYEMYRKWKMLDMIIEFIPIVASTTSGALLGVCSYDPDSNPSLIIDQDARTRALMSMKGARIWNVYSYGRVGYQDDGSIDWYFTGDGSDAKLSSPGNVFVVAASEFSVLNGPPSNANLSVCQVVIHYDCCFEDRALDEDSIGPANATILLSTIFSGVFGPAPTSEESVYILPAVFNGAGLSTNTNVIYIITSINDLMINNQVPFVDTETRVTIPLMSAGSVWYAFADQNHNIWITENLSDAMRRHFYSVSWSSAHAGTELVTGLFSVRSFVTQYEE